LRCVHKILNDRYEMIQAEKCICKHDSILLLAD
jgi:hypothetical protein